MVQIYGVAANLVLHYELNGVSRGDPQWPKKKITDRKKMLRVWRKAWRHGAGKKFPVEFGEWFACAQLGTVVRENKEVLGELDDGGDDDIEAEMEAVGF